MTTLKARVNGQWVPVSSGSGSGGISIDEVWVGTDDPIVDNPTIELWYDSDDDPAATDSANYWNSAWGILAEARWASTWTNASSTPSIISASSGSNSFTIFLYASRRYRLYWQGMVTSTVAADYVVLQHNINGANYTENNAQYVSAANAQYFTWIESRYIPATDGNYTFTVTGRRGNTSTGTVSTINSGNNPLWLMIEDLGPVVKAAVSPPAGQPVVATTGNALGIVAVGAMVGQSGVAISAATATPVSQPTSAFLAVGRRYRISGSIRATLGTAGAYLRITGPSWLPMNDTWVMQSGSYDQINIALLVDGTGITESFTLVYYSGAASTIWSEQPVSYFWIEDVGPNTSPAFPLPDIPPAWNSLSLAPTWTHYVSPYGPCSYRKVGDIVTMRGLATSTSTPTTICTLPLGFRPAICSIISAVAQDTWCEIRVNTDGTVVVSGAAISSGIWVSLNPISFSTTP